MSTVAPLSLLVRAAECYLRAGWKDDACRCFEEGGEPVRAARLHLEAGRFRQAALGFESAGLWTQAAECHLHDGAAVEAAECLLRAGDVLFAAWLLADHAHRFAQARALAAEVEAATASRERMRDLVLARCEAEMGQTAAAARRLRTLLAGFPTLEPGADRQRIAEWAVRVADVLRRPDLAARVHAAALGAGLPGAQERWDVWALATLGEAPSLPVELAAEPPPPAAPPPAETGEA